MTKQKEHKPVIETLINSAAIALTSFGVLQITTGNPLQGYSAVVFGVVLELIKYYGRNKNYW